ncbi:hypothetical protein EDD16DRAFT_1106 [Pisolithus croceorrhizus]|nr:hypothetical protein EV401DRAFT_776723 [Pisolithus croceorrhizus]KAI6133031.1 hypothetical protein EDD16DRAFT_1106 [Pisolithus croceorrhizus]
MTAVQVSFGAAESLEANHDIYRVDGQHSISRPADAHSIHPSFSSSSSDSSPVSGIGALAAVVEHAISRWAHRYLPASLASGSSVSLHTQRSSAYTPSRRHDWRRKGRPVSLNATISECDTSSRIGARQDSRRVPREFTLYLPSEMTRDNSAFPLYHAQQAVFRGVSLPHVLSRLENARKNAARPRTGKRIYRPTACPIVVPTGRSQGPNRTLSLMDVTAIRQSKGKQRAVSVLPPVQSGKASKAWWLDVANPNWDDLRAIGKLLHLHPLTLEDILQRDAREKLELFPKLGYRFIVFRAMDNAITREPFGQQSNEGLIGEATMYLVVFRDGICTFHFTDVSNHIERIRNRIQLLEDNVHTSSDWIAHGLLDSVVDSFFPILRVIEREVATVEAILFPDGKCASDTSVASPTPSTSGMEKEKVESSSISCNEKIEIVAGEGSRFSVPRFTVPLAFHHLKQKIVLFLQRTFSIPKAQHVSSQAAATTTLRRIARTRRLVTSLTRLLASKSEVVSRISKRYLSGTAVVQSDDVEIAMYMGDVQDHILALQQALSHHEHVLSQSHPIYLSQLRISVLNARKGSDKAVLILSLVSFGAMVPVPIIGAFSMNVHTPRNTVENPVPSGSYYWFGIVVAIVIFMKCCFLALVRYWWMQAKKRRQSKSM